MSVRYTDHIRRLPSTVPFVGPETTERQRGRTFRARIGANESVFGPSPKVIVAMTEALADIWKYADPESFDLKNALAENLGVTPANIMIGEGIDGLLGTAIRLIVEPGVKVITSLGAYPTFNFHVNASGGELIQVPFRNDHEDLDGLLDAAHRNDASILYVSNPDNPMGTCWPGSEIERLIASLPSGTTLFLDEAYVEFAPEGTAPRMNTDNPNVIRFRTFSKAHGMAGARIGYAIGHDEVITSFNKVRNHFGINRTGQIGAAAAIRDQEWVAHVRACVEQGRERLYAIAAGNGLQAIPSATNFVTIDCGRDGVYARAVLEALGDRDVFVRMPFAEPGNRCIRVGVGTDDDLDIFEEEFPGALKAALAAAGD